MGKNGPKAKHHSSPRRSSSSHRSSGSNKNNKSPSMSSDNHSKNRSRWDHSTSQKRDNGGDNSCERRTHNKNDHSQRNNSQYYPPYPYYYNNYYQGEYMPPPPSMWPPFYHHPQQYQQSNNSRSNLPSANGSQNFQGGNSGGFHHFFNTPPPLLPFGLFRNNQIPPPPPRIPSRAENDDCKGDKEPPPPGSEAAREKERAEIAKRLMDFDKKPPREKSEKASKSSSASSITSPPSTSSSKSTNPPQKKTSTPVKPKSTEKSQKRPSGSTISNDVPSKKANTSEINANILGQIAAMGREEIKGIVNNPQSPKSQEILKALMNHYRELKGVELDKRRLLAHSTNTSTSSYNAVLNTADAIEIADLPQEIINQLNNFLGFDLLGQESQATASNEVMVMEDENERQINGEPFPDNASGYEPMRIDNPEKILEELVMIDMRIQADIHRKMELYRQLHEIMLGQPQPSVETSANDPESQCNPHIEDILSPPPPMSSPSLTSRAVVPPKVVSPEQTTMNVAQEQLSHTSKIPADHENKLQKTKKTGKVNDKDKKTKRKSNTDKKTEAIKTAEQTSTESLRSTEFIEKIEELSTKRLEINLRSYSFEIYDMKAVDSNTVVLACSDHNLYGFEIAAAKKVSEYKAHVDVVTCLLPVSYFRGVIKEQIICSGGLDEHICIFGYKSQQCVSKYYVASPVLCLEYYHDLVTGVKMLYAGLKNGMIQLYDVEKFIPKGSLDCGNRAITAILATKEGPLNVLLVAAEDKTICLRDSQSGLYLRQYNYSYVATKFIRHGNVFFCQSTSNGVTLFDLNTGQYLGFLKAVCPVSRIARLKNILFVVLLSGIIKVYNMNTKQQVTEIPAHGKLLRYIDVVDEKIVAAARVNDLIIIPFSKTIESH